MLSIRQTEGGSGAAWGLGTALALLCHRTKMGPGAESPVGRAWVPREAACGGGSPCSPQRVGCPWGAPEMGRGSLERLPTGLPGAGLGVTASVAQA